MTFEEKLEKLTDSLTVQAELLVRHERQGNARFEQHEVWLEQLDRRLDAMLTIARAHQEQMAEFRDQMAEFRDQMAEFRSAAARLFELLDRFIRDQQGDGHAGR
jgi:DNA repair ATPase RecN